MLVHTEAPRKTAAAEPIGPACRVMFHRRSDRNLLPYTESRPAHPQTQGSPRTAAVVRQHLEI
jgi:hypothetical protein